MVRTAHPTDYIVLVILQERLQPRIDLESCLIQQRSGCRQNDKIYIKNNNI